MQIHEFYQKYANTPLLKRGERLEYGGYTLLEIYKILNTINGNTYLDIVWQNRLLSFAEEIFKRQAI